MAASCIIDLEPFSENKERNTLAVPGVVEAEPAANGPQGDFQVGDQTQTRLSTGLTGLDATRMSSGHRAGTDGTWKIADCNSVFLCSIDRHIANTCMHQA